MAKKDLVCISADTLAWCYDEKDLSNEEVLRKHRACVAALYLSATTGLVLKVFISIPKYYIIHILSLFYFL